MVILKIICENFKILHPIAILLGNKTSKTLKELSNFEDEEEEKNSKNAETNKSWFTQKDFLKFFHKGNEYLRFELS